MIDAVGFLYIFLQLESITLNHHIQIPHRRSTRHIPYCPTHQKNGKSFSASNFTHGKQRSPLRLREAIFEQVDVVGHNWYFYSKPVLTGRSNPEEPYLSSDESSVYNDHDW